MEHDTPGTESDTLIPGSPAEVEANPVKKEKEDDSPQVKDGPESRSQPSEAQQAPNESTLKVVVSYYERCRPVISRSM